MAGLIKSSERRYTLNLSANVAEELVVIRDTRPNTVQIWNRGSGYVYVSQSRIPSATVFDKQVAAYGAGVITYAVDLDKIYVISTVTCSVDIITYENEEVHAKDLAQTQETIIVNSTTTSSVVIADGGDAAFGGTSDVAETNPANPLSFMSYVKGILTQINSILSNFGINSSATQVDPEIPSAFMSYVKGVLTRLNTISTNLVAVLGRLPSAFTAGGGVKVGVVDSLPAGTNNIGDVDVLSLPALPAGSNNIGIVNVAAIAAGDNNIGNVDIVSLPSFPSGTNNIGKVTILGGSNDSYKATNCYDYEVTCTLANTEYSLSLPSNIGCISVNVRDGLSTNNYRISFVSGKVAAITSPCKKFSQSIEWSSPFEVSMVDSRNIYFASSIADVTIQVEIWRIGAL